MKARWVMTLVCLGLAALLTFPAALADGSEDDDDNVLVGTWRLTVTDQFGGSFFSLITFNADNTLVERPSTSSSVSIGVGVWEAIGDNDDDSDDVSSSYAATFDTFTDSNADTNFDDRLRIRLTLHIDGDSLTGTGTIEVRTLDNAVVLFTIPGAMLDGARMAVVPE